MQNSKLSIFAISLFFIIVIWYFDPPKRSIDYATDVVFNKNPVQCILDKIIDGDSVIAICEAQKIRIRLLGIDAPEMGQTPWGEKSKDLLATLLPNQFQFKYIGNDIYNRQLGIIFDENRDINLRMIEHGAAVAYRSEDTPLAYFIAEEKSVMEKKGIWSKSGHQRDPKGWRRHHL